MASGLQMTGDKKSKFYIQNQMKHSNAKLDKKCVIYGHTSCTKHTAYDLATVATITIHLSFFFLTTMNNLQNIVCNS